MPDPRSPRSPGRAGHDRDRPPVRCARCSIRIRSCSRRRPREDPEQGKNTKEPK